jgi:NAD(P)-dependent dehydrogenase (short-subunit alcohol dehydrogenase family)
VIINRTGVLNYQSMEINLDGQIALVTGAGAGIGQGIAEALAENGAGVVVADIDVERAEITMERIKARGGRGIVAATDVTVPTQVSQAVTTTVDRYGRLDILVNNAGGVRYAPFLEQDERSWRRHIDLNLTSVLAGVSSAAPIMIEGGRGGSIVNVASIEGLRAAPNYAVYAACKAGVLSFTRTMALELARHQIRVNAVTPDVIETPGIRGFIKGPVPDPLPPRSPEAMAGYDQYIPLGHAGVPADCADVVVFLCSDSARYVTGVTLPVDGGTWASSGWTRADQPGAWRLHS